MKKSHEIGVSPFSVSEEDLTLINKYTIKNLSADGVFAFNVILCDNEIDRDFDRFNDESLEKLAELFNGKTGIFDHSMKSGNQTARIFKTEVGADTDKLNSCGETYKYLKARAYIPITDKNQSLISEINAGIKKEVSINCSVSSQKCSICGKDIKSEGCNHVVGNSYSGKICHHLLLSPVDAYEWSFVAVPAQKNAGVIKSYKSKEKEFHKMDIFSILKSCDSEISITKSQANEILKKLEFLQKKAEVGDEYRKELKSDIMRLSCSVIPEISSVSMESICNNLSVDELKNLRKDFSSKGESLKCNIQLSSNKKIEKSNNNEFKI